MANASARANGARRSAVGTRGRRQRRRSEAARRCARRGGVLQGTGSVSRRSGSCENAPCDGLRKRVSRKKGCGGRKACRAGRAYRVLLVVLVVLLSCGAGAAQRGDRKRATVLRRGVCAVNAHAHCAVQVAMTIALRHGDDHRFARMRCARAGGLRKFPRAADKNGRYSIAGSLRMQRACACGFWREYRIGRRLRRELDERPAGVRLPTGFWRTRCARRDRAGPR